MRNKRITISLLVLAAVFAWAGAAYAQDLTELSAKLNSKKVEDRRSALHSLRQIGTPEAARIALRSLSDKNEMVRATAASVVCILPAPESVPLLAPLLNDKDAFVRRETAYALGKTSAGEAVAPIDERLRIEKDHEVQSALAIALGGIGNPAGVSSLVNVLNQKPVEDEEFVRRSAARSIGLIAERSRTGKSDETTPQNFLPDRYKDDLSNVRSADLSYFREAGRILIGILQSNLESADTKREAAFALGAIGDPAFKSVLEPLTKSDDSYLAEIAREALKRLSNQKQ